MLSVHTQETIHNLKLEGVHLTDVMEIDPSMGQIIGAYANKSRLFVVAQPDRHILFTDEDLYKLSEYIGQIKNREHAKATAV